jgi:hypothetical protein
MRLDPPPVARLITKLAILWIALLVLPFAERTLLGAKTYYFLYIGLGLVCVMYGLTIRHRKRPILCFYAAWLTSRRAVE